MVRINIKKVDQFAEKLKNMSVDDFRPLSFCGFDVYPLPGAPGVANFFFAVIMQQFGFWRSNERRYLEPVYGYMDGKKVKGSDWLWCASMRQYNKNPGFFDPAYLAHISEEDFNAWFSDDIGTMLLPLLETRFLMTRAYGGALTSSMMTQAQGWWNLERALTDINQSGRPLGEFLSFTRKLPGYNEDPFLKKNVLLAAALAARPEQFLRPKETEKWPPIIDYHLMRLALRTGMVTIDEDEKERLPLVERHFISSDVEKDVREKVFVAMLEVIEKSGKPMSFVDSIFWSAREYCPEMEEPKCVRCAFDDICAHRIELFQPVFRTTNY